MKNTPKYFVLYQQGWKNGFYKQYNFLQNSPNIFIFDLSFHSTRVTITIEMSVINQSQRQQKLCDGFNGAGALQWAMFPADKDRRAALD